MVKIGPTIQTIPGEEISRARLSTAERASPTGFHTGQVVEVELVRSIGDDEGIFRIAGRYFRALYPVELSPGVTMPLRVVDTGPPLVLRLPDFISQALAKLVHPSDTGFSEAASKLLLLTPLDAKTPEAAALLAKMQSILNLPLEPEELGLALARFFISSGIFREALLAKGDTTDDLKSLALKLLSLLKGDKAAEPLLKSLLSHIETYQARSLLQQNPVFPFLLNWGGEPLRGEFEIIEDEEMKEGQDRGGAIIIRLDMPNLGHVESALKWRGPSVAIDFRVPKELTVWFEPRLETLAETLKAIPGLNVTGLRVDAHPPPKPAHSKALLEITV